MIRKCILCLLCQILKQQSSSQNDKTEKHDGKQPIKLIVNDESTDPSEKLDLSNKSKSELTKSLPSSRSRNSSNGSAKVYGPEDLRIYVRPYALDKANEKAVKTYFDRYGDVCIEVRNATKVVAYFR
jgi:hypothetical protein